MSKGYFEDELNSLELNDQEKELAHKFVDSEKLKDWLLTTREGRAVDSEIKTMYALALQSFENCDMSDTKGMMDARLELEVAKRVYRVFNAVFQDGEQAEKVLTSEDE